MDLSVRNQPVSPTGPKPEWGGVGSITGAGAVAALETAALEAAQVMLPQIIQHMTAEALEAAWERLEEWRPSEGRSPAQNTQELQEQYLGMKRQILALEPPDEGLQAQLLTRLEAVVTGHAERLLAEQYGPLTAFLGESGQAPAAQAVKSSLLLFVLGKISSKAPAWPKEFLHQEMGARSGAARAEDYGMVHYGPGGKTDVRPPEPRKPTADGAPRPGVEEHDGPTGVVITRTAKRDALPLRFPKPFTPAELEVSNTFARHIRRDGMPGPPMGQRPDAGPEPEGWTGVRAGLLWLKGQLFAETRGVGASMAQVMQNGVERRISTVIHHAVGAAPEAGRDTVQPRRADSMRLDAVFPPFRAVVNEFQAHRDAKRAILSGLFYMLETLKTQEEAQEEPGTARPRDQAGNPAGPLWTPTERTKRWLQQIKSSWNQFRRDMGLRPEVALDFTHIQEDYSTWACALPPAETTGRGPRVSLPTLLGWCALALAVGTAVTLLWGR